MRIIFCVVALVGCADKNQIVTMERGLCDAYLACAGDATPDAVASLGKYGPTGGCWTNLAAADTCRTDCESNLLALRSANPSVQSCLPEGFTLDPTRPPYGSVGANCNDDTNCGENGHCLTEGDHYPGGYCTQLGCTSMTCPSGSGCYVLADNSHVCLQKCKKDADCGHGYLCDTTNKICTPGCAGTGCGPDELCGDDGLCSVKPCTATSCGPFTYCAPSGACEPDLATFPAGAAPDCPNLPERDCVGTAAFCGEMLPFEPVMGVGYDNYPINGETDTDQYRSFCRRDLQMLVKWAAAYVACKTASWTTGNQKPVGLGDMSEANGAIPGTRENDPGHPAGTHEHGYDMDFAYFQITSPNNYLREICPHTIGGKEQYHCVAEPNNVDIWRHSLLLGAMFSSPRMRVIGVDGRVGPILDKSIPVLCQKGFLDQAACDAAFQGLAYEQVDMGYGWYLFHLHHSHVSLKAAGTAFPIIDRDEDSDARFPSENSRQHFGFRNLALRHTARPVTE
jgi:hypothetical protein